MNARQMAMYEKGRQMCGAALVGGYFKNTNGIWRERKSKKWGYGDSADLGAYLAANPAMNSVYRQASMPPPGYLSYKNRKPSQWNLFVRQHLKGRRQKGANMKEVMTRLADYYYQQTGKQRKVYQPSQYRFGTYANIMGPMKRNQGYTGNY